MWFLTEEHVGNKPVKSETKRQPTLTQRVARLTIYLEALSCSISILTMNLNKDRTARTTGPSRGCYFDPRKENQEQQTSSCSACGLCLHCKGEQAMLCNVLYIMGRTVLQNHILPSPMTSHSSLGVWVSKQYSPSTACRSLCSWKQL